MTIQCPAFELPDSPLLNEETHRLLRAQRARIKALNEQALTEETPPAEAPTDPQELERQQFYNSDAYQFLTEHYGVDITTGPIGGVFTETFLPSAGIAPENKTRVLLNFHGGAFCSGSRTNSRSESIPVAALGKIKVISVDYRMAPAHRYPAATDDALAVYSALLQDYKPEQIGVFGSSAGAYITAQLMVRLQEHNITLPAAVAMIAGGGFRMIGDSLAIGGAIYKEVYGAELGEPKDGYFEGVDRSNPQVTPALSDQYMSAFPPSLLASSTRDFALSPVVATHRRLMDLGVEADLQLWEGLDHYFHCSNPGLPEAKELHAITAAFFNKHLGH